MKDRIVAALLAFFLGGFGIHQFYLGNNQKGILYLLFCWTTIPFLIAFIDFILLLVKDPLLFDEQYNQGRPSSNYNHSSQPENVADELEKLHSLKERGILTEAEFQSRKSQLI